MRTTPQRTRVSTRRPLELTEVAEPNLRGWNIKIDPGQMPRAPIAAICLIALVFFYSTGESWAQGDLSAGILAVLSLGIVVGAIVLIHKHGTHHRNTN